VDRQPNWRKIADQLKSRIEEGEFNRDGAGEDEDSTAPAADRRPRLPTELVLQEEYNASRNTIRDAIKWLADHGIVHTEPGRGTFIVVRRDPFHVTLSARGAGPGGGEGEDYRFDAKVQGRLPVNTDPRVEIQTAPAKIARQLGIDEGSQVILRHERRFIDNQPWSLVTSYYPWAFFEGGATRLVKAANIDIGVMKYLEETLGRRQVGYHDAISGRMPNEVEASFFGLPERGSVAVFETYRTGFDQDGNPLRLTITIWPIDRNRLHFNTGTVPDEVIDAPSAGPAEQAK
jgi:GntR family transcriptional regulator